METWASTSKPSPKTTRSPLRLLVVFLGVLWGAVGWAGPALAHSLLLGADPAPGSVQTGAATEVNLIFAGPVEASAVSLTISRRAEGETITLRPESVAGSDRSVAAALPPALEPGVYRIGYEVLGLDGHPVVGSYSYAYWPEGTPPPAGLDRLNEIDGEAPSLGSYLPRPAALLVSLPLAGLAFSLLVLGLRRGLPRLGPPLAVTLGLVAAAADLLYFTSASSPAAALRGAYGQWLALHAAGCLALALLLRRPALRTGPPGRGTALLAAAAGALCLVPLAATSHGATLDPRPIDGLLLDWWHLVAGAGWTGGVLWLLLRLADRDRQALAEDARTFARVVPWAVVVVVATGISSARNRFGSWDSLWSTGYGRSLLAKTALVGLVLLVANRNRLAVKRGFEAILRAARTLRAEGAGFLAILIASGVLVSFTPPVRPAPVARMPLLTSAVVGDQPYSVLMLPGGAGPNRLRLQPILGAREGPPPAVELVAGERRDPVALTPAGAGWSGRLRVPEGRARLRFSAGAARQEVEIPQPSVDGSPVVRTEVDLEAGGGAGQECRSRLIGQVAAVSRHNLTVEQPAALEVAETAGPCPASVAVPPAAFGRILGSYLARYDVGSIAAIVDSSGRSRESSDGLRSMSGGAVVGEFGMDRLAEARAGAPQAIVVLGGRPELEAVIGATSGSGWTPLRGVFLAPWLLEPDLLGRALADPGPQLTLGLDFDPAGPLAQQYLGSMGRFAPFEEPSSIGLAGFSAAQASLGEGPEPEREVAFYAATKVGVLPAELQHHRVRHLWLGEGGGLALVGPPMADPGAS